MLRAVVTLVLSLLKVVTYLVKQWKSACVGLLVGLGVRWYPQSWPGSEWLDAKFHRIAHRAAEPLGYLMLALLAVLLASLVYQHFAKHDGGRSSRFVRACDNVLTKRVMPAIAAAGAAVFGASVPFGEQGVIFAASFIVWLGAILCCLQVMADYAAMPSKS
ncbi:hypothetical protein AWB76_02500 [Caballeronia temeraria]|uniref:Uncharacterized protein n=1 Tax=Caballeronia temeraria TaxID=1777137 RepID=A0A158AJ03_9BURK|nr:hypothetical protein [Caballeronia temeraria]SAK57715.1 hypothetical protein AWB76_02500 [Caballeronia temeraria]